MSSYDIYFPKAKYVETERALQAAAESCYNKYRSAERSSDKAVKQTSMAHRSQRDRYQSTVAELKKERAAQEVVYRFTMEKGGRLDREKSHWFTHGAFIFRII